MILAPGYPKTMVHPSFAPAVLGRSAGEGVAARLPPVEVKTEDQEEYYRAMGYLAHGETGSRMLTHQDYPKMMYHPAKEPVTVRDEAEEEERRAEGYGTPVKSDPEAFRTAQASPYRPAQQHQEYPRWVDGKIVDPRPVQTGPIEFPKWVHGVIVQDRDEEMAVRAKHEPAEIVAEPPSECEIKPLAVKRGPGRPRKNEAAA